MDDFIDFVFNITNITGEFFEAMFIPPFLKEWDRELAIQTERGRKLEIQEKVSNTMFALQNVNTKYEISNREDGRNLKLLDEQISDITHQIYSSNGHTSKLRDVGMKKLEKMGLETKYETLMTTFTNRSQLIIRNSVYLNHLRSYVDILSSDDFNSDFFYDLGEFKTMMASIKKSMHTLSTTQNLQVISEAQITGVPLTSQSIKEALEKYG